MWQCYYCVESESVSDEIPVIRHNMHVKYSVKSYMLQYVTPVVQNINRILHLFPLIKMATPLIVDS